MFLECSASDIIHLPILPMTHVIQTIPKSKIIICTLRITSLLSDTPLSCALYIYYLNYYNINTESYLRDERVQLYLCSYVDIPVRCEISKGSC